MNRAWLRAYVAWAAAVLVGLIVITILVGMVVKAWSPAFDRQALQTVVSCRSSLLLTRFASRVTTLGSLAFVSSLTAVVIAWQLWRNNRRDGIVLATAVIGAAVIPTLSKLVVDRPRPCVGICLVHVWSSSFPSEHAVQAAAAYLAIALVLGRSWQASWRSILIAAAILVALVVGASRVYLGVHYPTDVAGGLLVGWGWGSLVSEPKTGLLFRRQQPGPGRPVETEGASPATPPR